MTEIKVTKENVLKAFQNFCRDEEDYSVEQILRDLFPEAFEEEKRPAVKESELEDLIKTWKCRVLDVVTFKQQIIDLAKQKVDECAIASKIGTIITKEEVKRKLDEM